MIINRLLLIFILLNGLTFLANTVTSTPFLAPNPIYSSAGIFDLYNSPSFVGNAFTFSLTFTRAHTTTTYSFGYSIQKMDYTIVGNKVQFSLQKGTKSASSISMNFQTNNVNKFASLSIAYIIIQPLFNLIDFQTCWIRPNSNMVSGQNFQATLSGVGPYSSGTQTVWAILVGVDADLSGNKQYDLYATASLASTTSILFQISTLSPTTFLLRSVILQAFIYDSAQLASYQRPARFTTGEVGQVGSLPTYTNSIMYSYNTIYGVNTHHTANQANLIYMWTLSSSVLSLTSSNTFNYVAFRYLILQFVTCAASTPYLNVASATCYDIVPSRQYSDAYNEIQTCPYDCEICTATGACTQCSSALDFRVLSGTRCIPLAGYYDNGVTVAVPCNSPCNTCSSATVCTSCHVGDQLSGTTCIPNPPCGNAALSASQACDDGNTVSGDGCDSSCQIQPYFACVSVPSVCNLITFGSSVSAITKSSTSNEFTVTFQLQPANTVAYSTLNWPTLVTQQTTLPITMSSTNYDPSQGTLSVTYSYTQSLNDATLILNFAFPNIVPFQNVPSATAQTTFSQDQNNLSFDVYTDSEYATARIIYIVSSVLSALAFFMFIVGFFGRKIISLQLITVFQVACLSITTLDRLSPILYGLTGLSYSFGYALNAKSSAVHNKYSSLNLKILFFNNYNLNLLLVLFPLISSLILIIYLRAKSSQDNKKLVLLQKRMRGQWLFYVMMFSLYVIILSVGFSCLRPSLLKGAQILGLLLISILLIITCYLVKCILLQDVSMGEFTLCFNKQKWIPRNYYFILSIERCLTSLAFLMVPISNKLIFLVMLIILVQIVMIVKLKPYKMYGETLRPFLNLAILLFIEIIYTVMQFTSSGQNYFPFTILGLLALTLIYNIYFFLKSICCNKDKSIYELVKYEQSKLLNSQRMKLELNSSFLINNHHAALRKQVQNIPMTSFDYQSGIEDIKSRLDVIRQIKTQIYAKIIPKDQVNDGL